MHTTCNCGQCGQLVLLPHGVPSQTVACPYCHAPLALGKSTTNWLTWVVALGGLSVPVILILAMLFGGSTSSPNVADGAPVRSDPDPDSGSSGVDSSTKPRESASDDPTPGDDFDGVGVPLETRTDKQSKGTSPAETDRDDDSDKRKNNSPQTPFSVRKALETNLIAPRRPVVWEATFQRMKSQAGDGELIFAHIPKVVSIKQPQSLRCSVSFSTGGLELAKWNKLKPGAKVRFTAEWDGMVTRILNSVNPDGSTGAAPVDLVVSLGRCRLLDSGQTNAAVSKKSPTQRPEKPKTTIAKLRGAWKAGDRVYTFRGDGFVEVKWDGSNLMQAPNSGHDRGYRMIYVIESDGDPATIRFTVTEIHTRRSAPLRAKATFLDNGRLRLTILGRPSQLASIGVIGGVLTRQ